MHVPLRKVSETVNVQDMSPITTQPVGGTLDIIGIAAMQLS